MVRWERIRLSHAGKLDRPRGVKTVQNCSTREVCGFINLPAHLALIFAKSSSHSPKLQVAAAATCIFGLRSAA